ncbi:DUF222 domain-containing protein [Williamsia maris]|uniref:DUF222 domain-containing protein n=1 Tax=Williamsia maris TaxID=72806 RepID=A0ABT1HF97_9NOCA|nr:DUF222 domain-containing protein [Williamsia maris]MCP2176405.1 protein of unknown function (DUF222) [Williamsia maris]
MIDGGWAGVSAAATGLLSEPIGAPINALLLDMKHAAAGQSYLEWVRLRNAAELHAQLVAPEEASDKRKLDALSRCATRVAVLHSMPQSTAERLIDTGVALRDRLPMVAECLRDGLITAAQVKTIVERTDLVTDPDHQRSVDADITESLRRGGSWSAHRMRDMIDRVIFRVDPAAVRARRKAAVDARSFWLDRGDDGMGIISSSMTAENAIAMFRRVETVAEHVCSQDPRTKSARKSDAHFCLVMNVAWECQCGNPDCDAEPVPDADGPAAREIAMPTSKAVVTVLCDLETAAGDGEDPGFIDGYGVVSADHIRDIIAHPATRIRPMGFDDAPLKPTQPGDPYRPSTALDTVIRARGLYCDIPGCNQPAWRCDLDHTDEYDHENPERGGQTCREGMGPKCRFHHNMKTFSDFLDTLTIDDNGRATTTIVTPEGLIVPGPAFTGDDLFPSLRDIEFERPSHAPPDPDCTAPDAEPTRRRTRLEEKHARRRTARAANQQRLDDAAAAAADAPEPVIETPPPPTRFSWEGFGDDPPF